MNQDCIGRTDYLAPFAVNALKKWLKLSGIWDGPIFRRVIVGTVTASRAVLGKKVARIIERRIKESISGAVRAMCQGSSWVALRPPAIARCSGLSYEFQGHFYLNKR